MRNKKQKPGDRALGMDASITRRDFLGSTLLASGAQLLEPITPAHLLAIQAGTASNTHSGGAEDWNGYGGVGEYASSNGNESSVSRSDSSSRQRG